MLSFRILIMIFALGFHIVSFLPTPTGRSTAALRGPRRVLTRLQYPATWPQGCLWSARQFSVTKPPEEFSSTLRMQTAAVGVVAGTSGAMIGLGGAFVVIPWLVGGCGLSQRNASGTSIFAVLLTALGSVWAFTNAVSDNTTDTQGNLRSHWLIGCNCTLPIF